MKVYISSMANNTVDGFKHCTTQWVAYECYLRLQAANSKRNIKVSTNNPGKLLILSDTHKHPDHDVTFQLTPKSISQIQIEGVEDNFKVTQDAMTAINTILTY